MSAYIYYGLQVKTISEMLRGVAPVLQLETTFYPSDSYELSVTEAMK